MLLVAGYNGWQQYLDNQKLEAGAKFAAAKALIAQDRPNEAAALFAALARENDTIYGTLSRFHEAALQASAGDRAGAAAALGALSQDRDLERTMRDLAPILAALNAAAAVDAQVHADLARLAEDGNPWRHTALEILGLIARRQGRLEEARGHFQRIVDDPDAPASTRARATELLAAVDAS